MDRNQFAAKENGERRKPTPLKNAKLRQRQFESHLKRAHTPDRFLISAAASESNQAEIKCG
jgi:hypothetical protein